MPKRMRPQSSSLVELVVSHQRFVVPGHQRAYGWSAVEIDRLLADLIAAMGRTGAASSFERPLFLGIVYLSPIAGGAEIADGQQRFITATIILAVLRDLASSGADQRRLAALIAAGTGDGYRLVLAERDAAFFAHWVQAPGATLRPFETEPSGNGEAAGSAEGAELSESRRNLVDNRNAIVARLQALGAAGCQELFQLLDTGTELIVITAPTLDEAREAHASTHRRGLRPTEIDQLKAEMIGDLPRAPRQELGHVWDSAESRVGKHGLEELIEHLIVIETERKPGHDIQGDLYRSFRLPSETPAFVSGTLAPGALSFEQIQHCKWGAAARFGRATADGRRLGRINGHLVSLARVTHATWKAPAILALQKWSKEPAHLETALVNLERTAAAYMIAGEDPNRVFEGYARVIGSFKSRSEPPERAFDSIAEVRRRARAVLAQARFGERDRCRVPVLMKLNDLLAGDVIAIAPGTATCEHILPQNPAQNSEWRQRFRASPSGPYNGHNHYQRIGNLVLLSYAANVVVDRHPYAVKRPTLARSEHPLTRDAAREREWTPDVIERRSERLIKLLVEHWKL